jgi:hypothetical protein
MESFCRFSRIFLLVILCVSSAGKIIFDSVNGSFATLSIPGAILSIIVYGMFITLTVGFILCLVWAVANLFIYFVRRPALHASLMSGKTP